MNRLRKGATMRIPLLMLALMLCVVVGCKKPKPEAAGGGGGVVQENNGVAQNIRMAAVRTISLTDLHSLHQSIQTDYQLNNKMPTKEQTLQWAQREAPNIYKHVQDGQLIITGTPSYDGVWAYTADPQTPAGEYLWVTSSIPGNRVTKAELDKRLAAK
jgi:hypothetical protein